MELVSSSARSFHCSFSTSSSRLSPWRSARSSRTTRDIRLERPIVRPPLVGFTGILYVITTSIALLSLVAPLTGFFSITTAEVVLVGYTLLILLRNTVAGLDSVPADAQDAAQGMGYTQAQELMKVQLPLALPSILAGVRVATVTTIG